MSFSVKRVLPAKQTAGNIHEILYLISNTLLDEDIL